MVNNESKQLFEEYGQYVDYQVNKCVTPIDHPYYSEVEAAHRKIISTLCSDIRKGARILDCGCGYGFGLRAFKELGFTNVVGADVSNDKLDAASAEGFNVTLSDMHSMNEFASNVFDVIYSSHSLEHCLYPDRALGEIARLLKDDGTFVLVLPYPVVLDTDHVRKAHCGAQQLNLTTVDNGENLIALVEKFGFTLTTRSFGSYRDEAEIYLKFVRGKRSLMIRDYGPRISQQNGHFNVQSSGLSAFWFAIDDPYESNLAVEFEGLSLKTARSPGMLSALVPSTLLRDPGNFKLRVLDPKREWRSAVLPFEVQASSQQQKDIFKTPDLVQPRRIQKPNFFIIGAPRSGTTSIYWHLASHPKIYMLPIKEPFFFDKRAYHTLSGAVTTIDNYRALYKYAPFDADIIGDASTTYLSSSDSLEKIVEFNRDSKVLIMLRSPIAATVSMYHQMCKGGKYERAPDFETAWRLQEERKKKGDYFVIQYRNLFSIGDHLEVALKIFSKEKIKVVLYDDFKSNSLAVYKSILNFLGVTYDEKGELPKTNSCGLKLVVDNVKAVEDEMVEYFRPQVEKVARYTGRSLDHWLNINEDI